MYPAEHITQLDRESRARLIQHYDAIAPRYSQLYQGVSRLAHFYNMRRARVEELLEPVPGGRLLEVGCGPGHMADHVAGRGMRYYGIDLSPGMIRVCREAHHGVESVHFAVGDTQTLALRDRSFDAVLCLGMLEYIPHEEIAIGEIARVLKPGGTCILAGINRWSPYNLWDRSVYRRLTGWQPAGIVHEFHAENDYRGWLQARHLLVVDVVYFDFDLFPRPVDKYVPRIAVGSSARLEPCCRSWCRRLGNGFLVKARKS